VGGAASLGAITDNGARSFDHVVQAPSTHETNAPRHGLPPIAQFTAAVRQAATQGSFDSLVLSKRRGSGGDLTSVRVRLIELRGEWALSFTYRHTTQDVIRNFSIEAGLSALDGLLDAASETSFAHATLQAAGRELQLRISKRGRPTLTRPAMPTRTLPAATAAASHDRRKNRTLSRELPFLVDLGITDDAHRLIPSMARKWRQIDKFLEVLANAIDAAGLPAGVAPRVVDFGCGKGYLTFAVHEYLRQRFGGSPEVTGVELRTELVSFCNRAVERCRCAGLEFVQGDLRSFEPEAIDIMIALHACDTATDHAIDLGVRAGASILICSPCCHKELRPQMTSPRPLGALFRHGIHLGQEAEMVTDSLRALLLEAAGYDAKVFEFVALEHTSKNKMILATRRLASDDRPAQALAEVDDLKAFYGIREQCLERLLRQRAQARIMSRG